MADQRQRPGERRSEWALRVSQEQLSSQDPEVRMLGEINQLVAQTNLNMERTTTAQIQDNAKRNLDAYLTNYESHPEEHVDADQTRIEAEARSDRQASEQGDVQEAPGPRGSDQPECKVEEGSGEGSSLLGDSGLAKRSEGGTLKQGEEGDPLQEPDPGGEG